MKSTLSILFTILVCTWNTLNAQVKNENTPEIVQDSAFNFKSPQKSTTYNTVTVKGNRIDYKAISGTIILKNNDNSPTASIFYAAYFKQGEKDVSKRPITFLYNGGVLAAQLYGCTWEPLAHNGCFWKILPAQSPLIKR